MMHRFGCLPVSHEATRSDCYGAVAVPPCVLCRSAACVVAYDRLASHQNFRRHVCGLTTHYFIISRWYICHACDTKTIENNETVRCVVQILGKDSLLLRLLARACVCIWPCHSILVSNFNKSNLTAHNVYVCLALAIVLALTFALCMIMSKMQICNPQIQMGGELYFSKINMQNSIRGEVAWKHTSVRIIIYQLKKTCLELNPE